ncbi:glycerophosphoryl diester phosphodiesterase [Pelomyxa schiedti]|nr:glycerophosphoryl diester phosphodiesterase [Pelomyxa schiedti]
MRCVTAVAVALLLCVGVSYATPYGGNVAVMPCDPDDTQHQYWSLDKLGGHFTLVSNGMCLDVESLQTYDGANAQLYDCDTLKRNQKWSYDSDTKQLKTTLDGKCLHVQQHCTGTYANADVETCASNSTADQWEWNGKTFVSVLSGHCLHSIGLLTPDTNRTSPLVIGHRGLPSMFPENTLVSFQAALDNLADGFETDLHLTSDGVIILMHDTTLERTTNCTGFIANRPYYGYIDSCDAGSWFGDEFAGTPVPLFEQALQLAKSYNSFIIMDLKVEGIEQQIADLVNKYEMQANVIASCWSLDEAIAMDQVLPSTSKQLLQSQPKVYDDAYFEELIDLGVGGFSQSFDTTTVDYVRLAHRHLMPVFTWTVDAETDFMHGILHGHDGFITDDCILGLQMVQRARMALMSL